MTKKISPTTDQKGALPEECSPCTQLISELTRKISPVPELKAEMTEKIASTPNQKGAPPQKTSSRARLFFFAAGEIFSDDLTRSLADGPRHESRSGNSPGEPPQIRAAPAPSRINVVIRSA